jgi:hypothetical protein
MDLRMKEWREAIVELGNAIENCPLTNRALAILLADCTKVKMTQAKEILDALPKLKQYYLKE